MESAEKRIKEQGICPYCGSDDIEWGFREIDDPFLFDNGSCCKCGRGFIDVYKIEYDGYNTFDEDGEEHLFDKECNEL